MRKLKPEQFLKNRSIQATSSQQDFPYLPIVHNLNAPYATQPNVASLLKYKVRRCNPSGPAGTDRKMETLVVVVLCVYSFLLEQLGGY